MSAKILPLRIGTRDSRLARVQTDDALRRMAALLPEARFEAHPFSSPGDRDRATDLRQSPADFFTRDLDEAVLAGAIDGAIHSAKDLPDPPAAGLDWCWLPWREEHGDVLVLAPGRRPEELPADARIGASSERREAWCRRRFPRGRLLPVRGNIEDRLAQLDAGAFDVLVMAGAALVRLGLAGRIAQRIPAAELPPPAGQGALALTFRQGDRRCLRLRSLLVKAVTFVSAGTGAGSCTQDGAAALRRADVCLHDALLDPALLDHLPPEAERVDVGKRGGGQAAAQAAINARLADAVRQGRRVVRLKGGDAGLFGRLAEEVAALDALELPYRVLPGVSSLLSATTGTGMLLTVRGVSRGFCAVTPRQADGGVAPLSAADRGRLPVVAFMAAGVAGQVASQMMADGSPPETPAALVYDAGLDGERIERGTLADIGGRAAADRAGGGERPALLLVGPPAAGGWRREWGALAGQRVLLTASDALQEQAAGLLHDLGGVPVRRPLIRLVPKPEARKALGRVDLYDWVAVTSPSAVRIFGALLLEAGVDLRRVPRLLSCGPGTDRELRALGFAPDVTAASEFGAAGLTVAAAPVLKAGSRVLRLRSDKAGPALAGQFRGQGAAVDDVVLYENVPVRWERQPEFDAAFFASASAVEAFDGLWGAASLAGKTVAALGEPTVAALRALRVAADVTGAEATVESCLYALASRTTWLAMCTIRPPAPNRPTGSSVDR
jgi:uroporphyrinogen III methyltransferase/synthase